jgi:hypothetical protein
MCLSPKMPKMPEPTPPPPPAPVNVTADSQPQTIKTSMSKRGAMRKASQGPSSLNIPLGGAGATTAPTPSLTNLSIGK